MIVGEVHEELGCAAHAAVCPDRIIRTPREGRLITKNAFDNIGGVRGALAPQGRGDFIQSWGSEGQEASRQLLLRLVTLGEGEEDSRRRVLISEVKSLMGKIQSK